MTGGLDQLYGDLIVDHAERRVGAGLLEDPDVRSHQVNPTCGDEIWLDLAVDPERPDAVHIAWEGHGCLISQGSASMLAELLDGAPRAELPARIAAVREMLHSRGTIAGDEDVLGDAVALAGVSRYVARVKCAMLAWVALEDAVARLP